MQEKRVNCYWNVDGDRILSDSWTGFTMCRLSDEKLPPGHVWSGRRLAKTQTTARPDCLWPEILIGISKAAKKQEKKEWAVEKPKLDNARKLRGICFIAPEDGEDEETIKNARRKLEVPMEAAMPCKKGTKKHSGVQETEVMNPTRFQR